MRQIGARSALAACLGLGLLPLAAQAQFSDNEARRAILELRQRHDAMQAAQQQQADELKRVNEENVQMRRSLLDLQTQIDTLRSEQAKARGQAEQLTRDVADLQRAQKDIARGVDDRLRKFEPSKVSVDGQEFVADPAETRDFEAALALFRKGDFQAAGTAFAEFIKRHPGSGYHASALFWLGNAQYAIREYKAAIDNLRAMLGLNPNHARAPEAALTIADCQTELKEVRGARATLENLVKAYPQSEAAATARERLAKAR